jgi:hypothetical protein
VRQLDELELAGPDDPDRIRRLSMAALVRDLLPEQPRPRCSLLMY